MIDITSASQYLHIFIFPVHFGTHFTLMSCETSPYVFSPRSNLMCVREGL